MVAKANKLEHGVNDEVDLEENTSNTKSRPKKVAKEHKDQLQRLVEKDPEFYRFLKENDKELLDFDDEDIDDDLDTDVEDAELQEDDEARKHDTKEKEQKPSKKVITTAMVDSWCESIRQEGKLSATRSLLRAYRTACHYGDDTEQESSTKFSMMSSGVFNKIMIFVLSEMDGILRKLFKISASGGKKETVLDLKNTKAWKNYNHLVKSYLGNSLHILNQMSDTEMISFTLRRLKFSSIFLVAFPSLLRKYIKVALHFWGTGGGALPVVSFLFLRDVCVRVGSDSTDECFKGIYKAYVLNCQYVNAMKLPHIQFLRNCVVELYGVDIPAAYQHAFLLIRQLAMILRDALNTKTKEAFRKVYEWKYINCLELWTGAICAYSSESDLRPLAYPLIQIIYGATRLVPTARYFPLRLRCVRMLNRIAACTGTFIPVSMQLLDMLVTKELNRPPTGGVGRAVDLRTTLKVNKATLKTRAFQEACVYSVIEELAEHLAQWSYSVAFFELSFIPAVRLRSFCKSTKVERFRKEVKQLIRQIEANSQFVNEKRASVSFLPNDTAATAFLQDEKKSGSSPLSRYVTSLRQRAQQRNESITESSVVVGENSSVFGRKIRDSDDEDEDDDDDTKIEEGSAAFSSSWLPGSDSMTKAGGVEAKEEKKRRKKKKAKTQQQENEAYDEDVVTDLVLSSDEDDGSSSSDDCRSVDENRDASEKQNNMEKHKQQQKKAWSGGKKSKPKKRKRAKF